MVRYVAVLIPVVVLVLACTRPAHAYLPSDGGSMLVQLLMGGFAGLSILARYVLRRVLSRLQPQRP